MALIKYGGGVVQMSGSIGGNTFARNSYGNYCRARTKPVNPNSARQVAVRTALAQLTARWSLILTDAQRLAWNLYGANVVMLNRLGESLNLSGFNHFLRSNVIAVQAGLTVIDDGPGIYEIPEADPTFAITASEATQTISYTFDNTMAWAEEVGAHMIKYQGSPQNPQRYFMGGPWRFHGTIDGAAIAPTSPDDEASPPFAFIEGQKQWCYARIRRADGRLSQPFRDDVLCSA